MPQPPNLPNLRDRAIAASQEHQAAESEARAARQAQADQRAKGFAQEALSRVLNISAGSVPGLTVLPNDTHPKKVDERPSYRVQVEGTSFVIRPVGDEDTDFVRPGGYEVFVDLNGKQTAVLSLADLGQVL